MLFFFSWGSKWKYNVKEGGLRVEKMCPECGVRGIFSEVIPTKYFSIFWIPVAPTEYKKPLLECPNCHERFYIKQADYLSAIKDLSQPKTKHNKVIHLSQDCIDAYIVPCDNCGQKLKVPKNDRLLRVTCPSCKNTFNFQKGDKVQEAIEINVEKKATSIDPHSKSEASEKTWWRKHLYALIGAAGIALFLVILITLFQFADGKGHYVRNSEVPKDKNVIDSKIPILPALPPVLPIERTWQPGRTLPRPEPSMPKNLDSPLVAKTFTPVEIYEIDPKLLVPIKPILPYKPIIPKRLPNGSYPFGHGIRSGHSTLTVDNGTESDAIVKVIRFMDREQQVRNFYIHNGRKWTEKDLPPGQYIIRVAFGRDWNSKSRKFNFRRSFSETEVFELTETTSVRETDEGQLTETHFKKMSITLHKVPLGNFKSHEINEEDFDR